MKVWVRIFFVSLFFVWLHGAAWADVIKVAYTEFAPYRMTRDDGTKYGIDIDFLDELASRLGVSVEYVGSPFERGLDRMQTGSIDMMIGMLRQADRESFMYFVEPAYKKAAAKAFYTLAGEGKSITGYEELYGKTVGVIGGVSYFPRFDSDPCIRKEKVVSFEQNLKKLLNSRVDVLIQTEVVGDYVISRHPEGGRIVKAPFRYDESREVFLTISRNSPLFERRKRVAEVVKQMLAEGYWETCLRRYMDQGGKPGMTVLFAE
ncbi:transporter substrate-binding domain-containing protein [Desulfovibrio mangrovi]|uniref:substrate-binding periplasmic protein n=1 Tax=Desulfovibrio mangrovi TaxID=2976983 RepID=UPI002245E035|nr:transporter substrate-binding domain-containing protein [Desulfovibrio mangrovi]UZP67821.1 transporter substrate-binding domain-containing protein [Desulfovibrio mangrovi]